MEKRENKSANNKKKNKVEEKKIENGKTAKKNADSKGGAKSLKKPEKAAPSMSFIAIISTVAVTLVIGLIVGIVFLVDAIKSDKFFDYEKSDLSKYVTLPETDYKNVLLEIDIAKPRPIDVEVAILNLLASDKGEVLNDGAKLTAPVTIAPGDVVDIWYRGYLLDEDGEEISVAGMCNFSGKKATSLGIGSGRFVPGFELNLVGKNTGDYPKFVKITEGEIKESQIAYVSYSRLVEGGNEKTDKKSGSYARIDLSDETVDETYGAGFRAHILSAKIGEKTSFGVTLDGKTHNYTDTTVNFVTECEAEPLVVECYFPYDYDTKTLRNENAYFEVYIETVQQYECPDFTDFNDDYVLKKVKEKDSPITEAELREYDGDTLAEKYRSYAKKYLEDAYAENYESMVEDALWDHLIDKAHIDKYPGIKVDAIHEEYVNDVYYQFDQTGGSIQNSYTQEYENYDNIDDFAVAYLGLTYAENKDWNEVLYEMSKSLVAERLILYYLIQTEGIVITGEAYEKEYEAVRQEYFDEYVKQYLEHEEKTREDYTDEEYEAFLADRRVELFEYYDEDYFKETAHYEIALRTFLTWPTVSTLDQRRAYPQNK